MQYYLACWTMNGFDILEFDPNRDSLGEVTSLLNRAYSKLADMGLNYVAATQGVRTTANRIGWATVCWVARDSRTGAIVGTMSYYAGAQFAIEPEWYHREEVSNFGQFAVEPAVQGSGLGSALLETVERRARFDGKAELACDTAVEAAHLVTFYERRGFRKIGQHQWPHAHYDSYILSKAL